MDSVYKELCEGASKQSVLYWAYKPSVLLLVVTELLNIHQPSQHRLTAHTVGWMTYRPKPD